jgi:putative endonuclease
VKSLFQPNQSTLWCTTRASCSFLLVDFRLETREKNFRCKLVKINLIMLDHETKLISEDVRYQISNRDGNPLSSLSFRKQQRIRRSAQISSQCRPRYQSYTCRFDVIGLSPSTDVPSKRDLQLRILQLMLT